MNNPFDYTPDSACDEAFRRLATRLDSLRTSHRPEEISLWHELESGKMLGILIATDECGSRHTLYAFSGQLGSRGFHVPGFVGPVFDYLSPEGYFKTKERDISRLNAEIDLYGSTILSHAQSEYDRLRIKSEAEIATRKEKYRLSKLERKARRESGLPDAAELEAMVRQSQFEKAELHRMKQRAASTLRLSEENLKKARLVLETLREKRRKESEALQKWLFSTFKVLNARGESKSLAEIFAHTPMKIPPSGAGECCAPKLLQSAYLRGWHPLAIAEYWYGKSKTGEVRIHGHHYPACRGKCLPLLGWMLEGLEIDPPLGHHTAILKLPSPEIIYENSRFCVVNKPSGMLSVPGKGCAPSVQEWLAERYGSEHEVKMAHRLDQATSGLIIATFDHDSYRVMQRLFATRMINKTYVADLEGDYTVRGVPVSGRISLPLSPDWLDRPRQRVDLETGREAITDYEFIEASEGRSRILFHPLTGRTHQLRIHAAAIGGLNMPIIGDTLYGAPGSKSEPRLHLHARKIEFTFPLDGHHYEFEAPLPF